MKITTSKENFVKGIQTIQSGMTVKAGSLPILQNFLMETEDQGIRIIFTDLEMAIKHFIPVNNVEQQGSVTVPIKKFMEIIQNLNDASDITFFSDESHRISINSGKAKFKIGGTSKNDYPAVPEVDETNSFTLPALKVAEMIDSTIFSVSTEDEKYFLKGLLWKYENGNFSMVATDGIRLAVNTVTGVKANKEFKVIVPPKILTELSKFIKSSGFKEEDNITVGLSSNQIGIRIGKTVFISRLTEGTFPAYERIIPQSHDYQVIADVQSLMAVTKRAAICANERTGSVKYTFRNGVLIVNSSSQNMDFEDEIPVKYTGEEFQIVFKPKYILDILKSISANEVVAEFKSSTLPALIKTTAENGAIYIVMPLRM